MASLDIEKKFLSFLLKDIKYFEKVRNKIKPEFISDEKERVICELLYEYYDKYLEIPTKLAFTTMLNDKFKDKPAEVEFYLLITSQLKNAEINESDFEFITDSIIDSYLRDTLLKNLNITVDSLDKKNIREIYDDLMEQVADPVASEDIGAIKRIDLSQEWESAIRHYDIKKKEKAQARIVGISTGIDEMDEVTGGWRPGELIVLIGAVGAGKSAIKLNLAQNANDAGADVLFVTLEMSWEELFDRRHSLITGVEYKKIRKRMMTDEEEREYYRQLMLKAVDDDHQINYLAMFDEKFGTSFNLDQLVMEAKKFPMSPHRFRILDVSTNFSVRMLETEIKKMQKKGKLDLVVIDYINIMQPSMKTADNWFNYGSIARELKLLARNRRVAILTSAQMGELGKEKDSGEEKKIKTQNIKYAKMIGDNADYVIGFSISEQDEIKGLIRLQMAKHRNTEKKDITVRSYFNRMKIETYHEIGEQIMEQAVEQVKAQGGPVNQSTIETAVNRLKGPGANDTIG